VLTHQHLAMSPKEQLSMCPQVSRYQFASKKQEMVYPIIRCQCAPGTQASRRQYAPKVASQKWPEAADGRVPGGSM
jgi:hypothetical protein